MKDAMKLPTRQQIALRIDGILSLLHKWGVETLSDLGQLDKEELRARLGPEAVVLWERATGRSTRLLKLVQPPESFAESFEFEHEVETIEPLLFILRRFLQQLAVRLNGLYLVAQELNLRIKFTSQSDYTRSFKIPQPTNDIDLLFRMLHTHLENFKSEYPIIAVSLELRPVRPGQQQFGLFETALRDPNQLYETLARLTGLLGFDRVGTPVVEQTYRADAFHMAPFSWQLPELLGVVESPPPPLALRRFRPGVAAAASLSQNQPVQIRSDQITGTVSARKGPFVSSGNWWDEKSWAQTEWDVELNAGPLLRCHQNSAGWQIDGIYD